MCLPLQNKRAPIPLLFDRLGKSLGVVTILRYMETAFPGIAWFILGGFPFFGAVAMVISLRDKRLGKDSDVEHRSRRS